MTFQEKLKELVSPFPPQAFAPAVSGILHSTIEDLNQRAYFPPHQLVNLIEANCAYYDGRFGSILTMQKIYDAINHYKSYYDPYYKYVLSVEKDLPLFGLAASKEQFPFQRRPNSLALSRLLALFLDGSPLPTIEELFQQHYKLSIREWIYLCLAVFTQTTAKKFIIFHENNFYNSTVANFPKKAVKPFLELESYDKDSIADQFFQARKAVESHLQVFIESPFLRRPLLNLPGGNYLNVHPYLVLSRYSDRLHALCSLVDEKVFGEELGESFQNYVGEILADFPNLVNLRKESQLIGSVPDKVSDFVCVFENLILIVECKATRFSARFSTKNAIASNNSTGKIANAYEQILYTARRMIEGKWASLGIPKNLPLFGLCVTFGEFEFGNTDYYFENFIKKRADFPENYAYWPAPLESRPEVISIESLEQLAILLKNQVDLEKMLREKVSADMASVGDWPTFLLSEYTKEMNWSLPIVEKHSDDFFNALVSKGDN